MKQLFKLVANNTGYGFVLNQYTVLCLESTFHFWRKRNICLLLKNSLDLLSPSMENILYIYWWRYIVYDEACNVLRLKHYLHSPFQKSMIERVNQYFKDRIESFDDYYPCMQKDECNLLHVYNWIQFFVSMYNDTTFKNNYFINELNERGEYYLKLTSMKILPVCWLSFLSCLASFCYVFLSIKHCRQ